MNPILSIITINFNDATGLQKTIESVVSQNFKNYEYIIIDGASSDGSADVIKRYADKITYWVSEKDTGVYNAMNKGIEKAKGEYCLFLNSGDCLIDDTIIEKVFSENRTVDILYGELIFDYGEGNRKLEKRPNIITKEFLFVDNIWHPASFIRRKLFDTIGLYSEKYRIAGDYDFFFHAIVMKKVTTCYIPYPISIYDTNGLSSDLENLLKINNERDAVHHSYLSDDEVKRLKRNTIKALPKKEQFLRYIRKRLLLNVIFNVVYKMYASVKK